MKQSKFAQDLAISLKSGLSNYKANWIRAVPWLKRSLALIRIASVFHNRGLLFNDYERAKIPIKIKKELLKNLASRVPSADSKLKLLRKQQQLKLVKEDPIYL